MPETIAQDALDRVPAELFIDEVWSVRDDHSLSWVGHALRQDFTVCGPRLSLGIPVIRLASSVPVVEDVTENPDTVVEVLASLNGLASGEALVWDDINRRVLCCSGVTAHRDTLEWRVRQLTCFSIVGLTMSELYSESLAERLGGSVAVWAHPDSGRREEPDDMLGVLREVIVPAGKHPSRFACEEEFVGIADRLEGTPFFSLGGSAEGIAVEVAIGALDTVLVHARTTEPHPFLGNGLLITTLVPPSPDVEKHPAWIAAELNQMESCGTFEGNTFGAWCTHGEGAQALLAHALFVPNILYRPGVTEDFILNAVRRADWVSEVLSSVDAGVGTYD